MSDDNGAKFWNTVLPKSPADNGDAVDAVLKAIREYNSDPLECTEGDHFCSHWEAAVRAAVERAIASRNERIRDLQEVIHHLSMYAEEAEPANAEAAAGWEKWMGRARIAIMGPCSVCGKQLSLDDGNGLCGICGAEGHASCKHTCPPLERQRGGAG